MANQENESALAARFKSFVLGVAEDGVGPLAGSVAYAQARLKTDSQPPSDGQASDAGTSHSGTDAAERAIQRIIHESVMSAGTQGLVTGLGGFVAMPVTLPANIAGNLIINARMVGAIAHLRGYDLRDPHTQSMLMLVVAGSSAQTAFSAVGVKVGQETTKQTIKKIPIATIRAVNKRVGFMLIAKYGTKRAPITLAKGVPLIGGLVSSGFDATLTGVIGKTAKKAFPAL